MKYSLDSSNMTLPFDNVLVRDRGEISVLTVGEFLRLDFVTRIRLVMTGSVEFREGGAVVPQGQALKALQQESVKK